MFACCTGPSVDSLMNFPKMSWPSIRRLPKIEALLRITLKIYLIPYSYT